MRQDRWVHGFPHFGDPTPGCCGVVKCRLTLAHGVRSQDAFHFPGAAVHRFVGEEHIDWPAGDCGSDIGVCGRFQGPPFLPAGAPAEVQRSRTAERYPLFPADSESMATREHPDHATELHRVPGMGGELLGDLTSMLVIAGRHPHSFDTSACRHVVHCCEQFPARRCGE